ncbi:MAG: di-trans,poly-cis-decaprenylcistransferase [Firmicutes bacterium]|nr:di-trans,poly-cis-decaprenylcistransferase [Bacillota bacterium]
MSKFEKVLALPPERIPQHIAIILDGNGRWAKENHLARSQGHLAGANNVETITYACMDMGVKYLTVYAFSTENWSRSEDEVSYLMFLLKRYLIKNKQDAIRRRTRIRVIGNVADLKPDLQALIRDVEDSTADLTDFNLTFAINYGGRDELVRAVRGILEEGPEPSDITAEVLRSHLDTHDLPDPDLLIRTGGELRISNFLLWQLAYSEFYFLDKYWPDFTEDDLEQAVLDYAGRERRFGGRK